MDLHTTLKKIGDYSGHFKTSNSSYAPSTTLEDTLNRSMKATGSLNAPYELPSPVFDEPLISIERTTHFLKEENPRMIYHSVPLPMLRTEPRNSLETTYNSTMQRK